MEETLQKMWDAQVKSLGWIYGGIDKIPPRHLDHIVVTTNLRQNPEFSKIAPHRGKFEFGEWIIERREVDQLVNFYAWKKGE